MRYRNCILYYTIQILKITEVLPPAQLISKKYVTEDYFTSAIASLASKGDLETQLNAINQKLLSQIQEVKNQLVEKTQANFNAVALSQRINTLSSPTISSPTISSPTISNPTISSPTISGNASLESLSVSSNVSVSGNLTVSGTQTFSGNQAINGNLTIGDATSTDIIFLNSKIAGSILPTSDNVLDIGGPGQRFQTGYFGTSVVVGGGTSTSSANSLIASGAYTIDSAGILSINTTNNQNIVTGTGNFGIGTSTPNWKLQVAGVRPFFALSDTGATANLKHWTMSSQSGNFYFATSSDALATSTIPALMIDSNGRLGIATTSPYAQLSVNGLVAAANFNADNASATSTLAGGLTVDGTSLVVDYSSGNVGIGTANPTAKLYLYDSLTNASNNIAGGLEVLSASTTVTTNGTNYFLGIFSDLTNQNISAGVTDSGYRLGIRSDVYASNVGFAGTLANQYGIQARAGIETAISGAVVTNAYGGKFEILNRQVGTTITNAYGVYIENSETTGTITNRYDLYASSANAKNYFAGNVGIGTTTPNWLLQTAGTRPFFALSDTGATANLKHWTMSSQSGNFYFATSSDALATSTIPALMIDSNGRVGIGTAEPTVSLDITGTGNIAIFGNQNTNTYIGFAGNRAMIGYDGSSVRIQPDSGKGFILAAAHGTWGSGTTAISIGTNGVPTFPDDTYSALFTGGNVGIGTTTPNWRTQIAGTRPFLTLSDTGATANLKHWTMSSQSGNFYFATSSDALATSTIPALMIDSNGRLGIATTSPYAQLSVNGLIAASNFNADNASATSTFSGGLAIETSGLVYDWQTNNVGIGTAAPASQLTLYGSAGTGAPATGTGAFLLSDSSGTTNAGGAIIFGANGASASGAFFAGIKGLISNTALNSMGHLAFYTRSAATNVTLTEQLRIDVSGKIGIGTTTPNWLLQTAGIRPFFALSDVLSTLNKKHWTLSSQGGNFYIATSSDALATSTIAALTIDLNGKLGLGSTSPMATLSVNGNIAVAGCVKAATSSYNITPENNCADIAEYYPNSEEVEPGDIAALDSTKPGFVKKAAAEVEPQDTSVFPSAVIGIVSTNPAVLFEGSMSFFGGAPSQDYFPANSKAPIALAGRVPVKVNLEGGEINVGDRIDLSSIPGIGKKATSSGMTVGIALENFDGSAVSSAVGKILVFVNLGYSRLDSAISGGGISLDGEGESAFWGIDESSGQIKFLNGLDLNDFGLINVKAIRGSAGQWSIDGFGKLVVKEIETEKLQVKSEAIFGSQEKRIGITIFDEDTGQPYCIKVKNGAMISAAGACGAEAPASETTNPNNQITNEQNPPAEEPPVEEPTPEEPIAEDFSVEEPVVVEPL